MPLTVHVREVVAVTPRARLLRLDLGEQAFSFAAGQAVLAGPAGQPARKPYAIACAPSLARRLSLLELLVQIDPESPAPHLEDATAGAALEIEGPFGAFTLRPPRGPLLFVAGGTGIAPLRAMLWEALIGARPGGPPPRMALVYSARSRDDLAFAEELAALAEAGRLDLHLTTTRDHGAPAGHRQGRIDAALLRQALPSPIAECYVCGPEPFVREVAEGLIGLGLAPGHIHAHA